MNRIMKKPLVGLLGALALSPLLAVAEVTAVKASRLFDVEQGRWVESPVVLIENERITAVGANLPVPEGARLIDLGGKVILPGLIDAHVHIAGGGWGSNDGIARSVLRGAGNARRTLEAGFTTVRSMGGGNLAGVALRDAVASGDVAGPRIFDAGTLLGVTGGHCGGRLHPDNPVPSRGNANGAEEFVKRVREQSSFGADFIKICITGGFTSGTSPAITQFREEEVRAVVETAHNLGLKVAVHAYSAHAVKLAVELGADSIEHGSLIDDQGIRLLKRNPQQVVVPTLSVFGTALQRAERVGATPAALKQLHHVLDVYMDNVRKIVRAGIPVIYGSDGPPGNNFSEFPLLVDAGLTPVQVLQSATIRSAEFLGAAEDIGSVSVGKYADIVAYDTDPLEDIDQFSRVSWVMKGGVVYKEQ